MKLYTYFTPSHKIFFDNYFLKTVPKTFELCVTKESNQFCKKAFFYSPGWNRTTANKIDIFIKACSENISNYFFYCDIDVQFFDNNIIDILLDELGDYDIACQDDIETYNSGVFICKANNKTLRMFETMRKNFKISDQPTLNNHIHMCDHKKLSKRFFTTGFEIGLWKDKEFNIPNNIVMHHANWVLGIDDKIKALNIVRSKYESKL